MRVAGNAWILTPLMLTGCGLVLDLDPPDRASLDAAVRDAGTRDAGGLLDAAVRDGGMRDARGLRDAAARDGGARDDAGRVRDASLGDAGLDCRSSLDCPAGAYCARPRGVCHGPGTCTAMPAACPDIADPVCGCDWAMHGNPCDAASRGVNVMQDDACPSISAGGHWCGLVPSGSDPEGCRFCFDDADCTGGLATICVASSCESGVPGTCAFTPPLGSCYDDRQCRETERCDGASNEVCPARQGRCAPP